MVPIVMLVLILIGIGAVMYAEGRPGKEWIRDGKRMARDARRAPRRWSEPRKWDENPTYKKWPPAAATTRGRSK